MSVIGYKAFEKDFTCRGFQYEVGKTYDFFGELELCESGFHFCENIADCFTYYGHDIDARFAKIEALGTVLRADDDTKCVTNRIRIIEEITKDEAVRMSNTGNGNTGSWNSGSWNSGNRNSGSYNSGSWNSGNRNSGHRNSGNFNTGDYNSGSWNTGNWNIGQTNTGNRNSGNRNSGSCNSGNWNSGNYNSGSWNSGNFNSGNFNTGDWNRSDQNTGCFMTVQPTIMMFNQPTDWTIKGWRHSRAFDIMKKCPNAYTSTEWVPSVDMTDEEKMEHPEYKTTHGYLKAIEHNSDRQKWWIELPEDQKQEILNLPNFNALVFYECTGIYV